MTRVKPRSGAGRESRIEPQWLNEGDQFVSKVLNAGTVAAPIRKRVYGTVVRVFRRYVETEYGWEVRPHATAIVVVRLAHARDPASDREPGPPHESEITYSEVLRRITPEEFAEAERLRWPMNIDLSRVRSSWS
jgi:hypothetical protein